MHEPLTSIHTGHPQPVVNTIGCQNLLLHECRRCSATFPVSIRSLLLDSTLTTLGWLTAIGWQVYLASVCFLVGTIIQGLIVLNDPTYVYERWQGTLLAIAVIFFSIFFNTFLASRLPIIGKSSTSRSA
jgi:hypothetical protein